MKSTKKIWLVAILILILTLSACGGQTVAEAEAEANATEVDPAAIFTSAAATVGAQLTETAIAFSPTPEPATDIPALEATATLVDLNTPLPILIEATPTLVPGIATFTPIAPTLIPTATQGGDICDAMIYGSPLDITIPDGTIMEPGEDFHKIWRVYNAGVCTWDDGYQLVIVYGATSLDAPNPAWKLKSLVLPGGVIDIGVHLTAPLAIGEYQNCFILENDRGVYFGGLLCVDIMVQKAD